MDRLWTPWRYNYITGTDHSRRKGVPAELDAWPGEDRHCVFCNLIQSVEWRAADGRQAGEDAGESTLAAEKAGLILARQANSFICLNAFPYSSGHMLLVPYHHANSLTKLEAEEASELMETARTLEPVLTSVYKPDGINLGINLGEAAGAGVADHLHVHMLPRWYGDTNFMTVTAESRVLPEALEVTWQRLRAALHQQSEEHATLQPKGAS